MWFCRIIRIFAIVVGISYTKIKQWKHHTVPESADQIGVKFSVRARTLEKNSSVSVWKYNVSVVRVFHWCSVLRMITLLTCTRWFLLSLKYCIGLRGLKGHLKNVQTNNTSKKVMPYIKWLMYFWHCCSTKISEASKELQIFKYYLLWKLISS